MYIICFLLTLFFKLFELLVIVLYCNALLHGSETWPVRKENEVALQRAEMRMVRLRWLCDVKVKDKVASKDLRERDWE